jgi:F-type H+-transporting ATPase subunit delta
MKATPKQYALALLASLKGKNDGESVQHAQDRQTKIVRQFVHIVVRNGMQGNADAVIRSFREEWNRQEGEVDVTLTTARDLPKTLEDALGIVVRKLTGAQSHTIRAEEDPNLIGGAVIQFDDTRIDGSIKKQLHMLKQSLTQ